VEKSSRYVLPCLLFIGYLSTSVENWKRRTEIVSYCVDVVDKTMDEKRQSIQDQANDPSAQRQTQAALYADEVKVRVIGDIFILEFMPST
jgi:hypothetical protein